MATHPIQDMPGPTVSDYEGLHFERFEDGSVMIYNDDHLVIHMEPAGIVADVSWAGRTPDRQERALRFHGEPDEDH